MDAQTLNRRTGCCCPIFISESDARARHLDCCPTHGTAGDSHDADTRTR